MTKFHQTSQAGPHEARLRQRLAEMRDAGLRHMRVSWGPGAIGLTREERCEMLLDCLDASAKEIVYGPPLREFAEALGAS